MLHAVVRSRLAHGSEGLRLDPAIPGRQRGLRVATASARGAVLLRERALCRIATNSRVCDRCLRLCDQQPAAEGGGRAVCVGCGSVVWCGSACADAATGTDNHGGRGAHSAIECTAFAQIDRLQV